MSLERQENTVNSVVLFDVTYGQGALAHAVAETLAKGTLLALNTATGKLNAYVSGGANGTGNPSAILVNAVAHDGVTDVPVNPVRSGSVRRPVLVAHGVGAITDIEALALQNNAIIAQATVDSSDFDN